MGEAKIYILHLFKLVFLPGCKRFPTQNDSETSQQWQVQVVRQAPLLRVLRHSLQGRPWTISGGEKGQDAATQIQAQAELKGLFTMVQNNQDAVLDYCGSGAKRKGILCLRPSATGGFPRVDSRDPTPNQARHPWTLIFELVRRRYDPNEWRRNCVPSDVSPLETWK